MSHQAAIFPGVPKETARTATAVFGSTNFYIRLGEQMDTILVDAAVPHLSAISHGLQAPWTVLPFVTFFQFVEGLTDEQALEAFRVRSEWKYALHLPMHVLLFSQDALCGFRKGVAKDPVAQHEFQALVDRVVELDPPINHTQEEYQVMAQLSSICAMNRLECVMQAMSRAIQALATGFPAQLRRIALPHWYGRYNRLAPRPAPRISSRLQDISITSIGVDILHLLGEVDQSGLSELKALPEVAALRRIWKLLYENHNRLREDGFTGRSSCDCDACILREGGAAADIQVQ